MVLFFWFATRGPSLFSDWNTEIALRAPKSVPIGWYVTELVLKGIHRVPATDFEMSHQGAKFILTETQKWHSMGPNQSEWADIWLSWSWKVHAEFMQPILKTATRGLCLFSDWNAEMALNATKSVWTLNGLIFGWVGLERYKQSPFNWFCNQPHDFLRGFLWQLLQGSCLIYELMSEVSCLMNFL